MSYQLVTAKELMRDLKKGHGFECKGGRAPEGFLEVWPHRLRTIWHISYKEHEKFGEMYDREMARRRKREEALA
jgi:hypothetical protein